MGFGEAGWCRLLGLRGENIGTNRNPGCLPSLRISGDLSDLCSLGLDTRRLKNSSGREEGIVSTYVEALLGIFGYMKLHVRKKIDSTIEHVKVLDYIHISRKNRGLEMQYTSACLTQEYSMNLLVALLLIIVLSS